VTKFVVYLFSYIGADVGKRFCSNGELFFAHSIMMFSFCSCGLGYDGAHFCSARLG